MPIFQRLVEKDTVYIIREGKYLIVYDTFELLWDCLERYHVRMNLPWPLEHYTKECLASCLDMLDIVDLTDNISVYSEVLLSKYTEE